MGNDPSRQTVDLYFASAAAINLIAWYVTPAKWRSVLPVAVTAVQVEAIRNNYGTVGPCW